MMSSKTGIEAHPLGDRLKLSAAMPAYAGPMQDEAPQTIDFMDAVKIPSIDDMEELGIVQEFDNLLEEEFDEAAVPTYQMIQTYDRKKLKMKKHQRAKRKEKMRIKLKWSGKL